MMYSILNIVNRLSIRYSCAKYERMVYKAISKSNIAKSYNNYNTYIDELKHTDVFKNKTLLSIRKWKNEYLLNIDTIVINLLRNLEYLIYDRYKMNLRLSREYLLDYKSKITENNIRNYLRFITTKGVIEEKHYNKKFIDTNNKVYSAEYYISVIGSIQSEPIDLTNRYKSVFISKIKELISQHTPVVIGINIYPEIITNTRAKFDRQHYNGSLNTKSEPIAYTSGNIVGYDENNIYISLGWGSWFGDNGLLKLPIETAILDIDEAWYFKFPNVYTSNKNKIENVKSEVLSFKRYPHTDVKDASILGAILCIVVLMFMLYLYI